MRKLGHYPANPDSEYGWEKLFSEAIDISGIIMTKLDGTWRGKKHQTVLQDRYS